MNARILNRIFAGLLTVATFVLGGCSSTGMIVPYDRPYNIDYWHLRMVGQTYQSVPSVSGGMTIYLPAPPVVVGNSIHWGGSSNGVTNPQSGERSRYSLKQLEPKLETMKGYKERYCSEVGNSKERWPTWECRKVVNEIAFLETEITKEERAVGAQCRFTKSARTGQTTVFTEDCSETEYKSWRNKK